MFVIRSYCLNRVSIVAHPPLLVFMIGISASDTIAAVGSNIMSGFVITTIILSLLGVCGCRALILSRGTLAA
jgi:hypothetical protein